MFQNLAREDLVGVLTFPIAAFFFACATAWLNHVHKIANAPLFKKQQDLEAFQQEAEKLNHSSTILLHGKKMREIIKLEDEIKVMQRNRNTTRRYVVLTLMYYFIQSIGFVFVYLLCKKLAAKNNNNTNEIVNAFFGGGVAHNNLNQEAFLDEIVMVPHIFTSFWFASGIRSPIPFIGEVRSFGFAIWYVFCLITVRVVFDGIAALTTTKRERVATKNTGDNEDKIKSE